MSNDTEEVSDAYSLEISTATASSELLIISSAFEKFKSILSSEEAAVLTKTTLDGFWKTLDSIQLDQARSQNLSNLMRLKPLTEAFYQLESILEVYLNVSPYMLAIWGPLQFVLMVSKFLFITTASIDSRANYQ